MRAIQSVVLVGLVAHAAAAQSIRIRLEATDQHGAVIQQVQTGDRFFLSGYVEDIRAEPQGIFSVYIDLSYTDGLVTVDKDEFRLGDSFSISPNIGFETSGMLNELGGIVSRADSIPPIAKGVGITEELFFQVPYLATAVGDAAFELNMADLLPRHATTLIGLDNALSESDFAFGKTQVSIVPEPPGALLVWLYLPLFWIRTRIRKKTNEFA